jgi:hypothetical protein
LITTIAVQTGDQTSMLHAIKMVRDSIAAIVGQVRSSDHIISSASSEIAAHAITIVHILQLSDGGAHEIDCCGRHQRKK